MCFGKDKGDPEDTKNNEIERGLAEEHSTLDKKFKILLLGVGESGKSTFMRQLLKIYKDKYDQIELERYAEAICYNTIQCMQALLNAIEKFDLKVTDDRAKDCMSKIGSLKGSDSIYRFPPDVADDIAYLWKHPVIQQVYEQRSKFWILENAKYYFDNITRFGTNDFIPTEDDCIMARVRTTGILTSEFDESGIHYQFVDVGGQRNERKKWIHCFDDVKALIFVCNCAGYNQRMFEDANKIIMAEAIETFQKVMGYDCFKSVPIFVFLNKRDLFETSIKESDLTILFPEYTGGQNAENALKFIEDKFRGCFPSDRDPGDLQFDYLASRYTSDVKKSFEHIRNYLAEKKKLNT